MSVGPSVCPQGTTRLARGNFYFEFHIEKFVKSVQKFELGLNSDKNDRQFTCRPTDSVSSVVTIVTTVRKVTSASNLSTVTFVVTIPMRPIFTFYFLLPLLPSLPTWPMFPNFCGYVSWQNCLIVSRYPVLLSVEGTQRVSRTNGWMGYCRRDARHCTAMTKVNIFIKNATPK